MTEEGLRHWLGRRWVQCLLLFVGVAWFYTYNASPQPGYVDSAMVAANVYSLRISSWVNIHLLHNVVGKLWMILFPYGEIAWRLIILDCLITAAAIVNLYRLLLDLRVSTRNALIASVGTALAHGLWWHAVTVEVYCINAFFTPLICIQVLKAFRTGELRFYYRAAFYYGLSATNHVLMGLFVFAFIGSVLTKDSSKTILKPIVMAKTLGWFFLGWQPSLLILFNDVVQLANRSAFFDPSGTLVVPTADALRSVLDTATGGPFKKQMFVEGDAFGGTLRWYKGGSLALVLDFPNILLLTAVPGMFALWKRGDDRPAVLFMFGGFAANFVWVMHYAVWDQWAFAIPSYMLWGAFAGVGLDTLERWLRGKREALGKLVAPAAIASLLIGPWWYVSIERWARTDGFWKDYFSFFAEYEQTFIASDYFASPFKRHWDQPRRYMERLYEILPEGAVVYDDHGRSYYLLHLYYNACLGERRDLTTWNVSLMGEWKSEIAPHGERLIQDLALDVPIFMTSTKVAPGRLLLAYVSLRLSGAPMDQPQQLEQLARQPLQAILARTPDITIEPITIFEGEPMTIYRVRARRPLAEGKPLRLEERAMLLRATPASTQLELESAETASEGERLVWSPVADGDGMELGFMVPQAGVFTLKLGVEVGGGSVRVSLDGKPRRTLAADGGIEIGSYELAAGAHTIRFDPVKLGSRISLDYLEIRPK